MRREKESEAAIKEVCGEIYTEMAMGEEELSKEGKV